MVRQFAPLLASASILAIATPVHAQDAAPAATTTPPAVADQSTSDPSEIIVTAQRRAEALQDVPIAVSAFSEADLRAARLDGANNLVLKVPNLNFSQQLYGSSNFSIRGIGYTLVTTAGDQGVGVAVNYAPIDRARITDAEFYDVERVEVLRGPQGTLYGRNATGGVINILTNKPRFNDYSASATAEYGNYDTVRLRGFVNLSPREDIGLRVAGIYVRRDGTVRNDYTRNDIDGRDFYSFRATLGLRPAPNFRVTYQWEHFHEDDSRAGPRQACLNDPGPSSVGGVPVNSPVARSFLSEGCQQVSIYAPGALTGTNNSGSSLSGQLTNLLGYTAGDVNAGTVLPDDLFATSLVRDPRQRVNTNNYQMTLEWEPSDTLALSSITNRNIDDVLQTSGLPPASTPFAVRPLTPGGVFTDPQIGPSNLLTVLSYNTFVQKQWSQELRLQSSFNGPVNFNLGGFYYQTQRESDIYFFANGQTIYARTAVPSAYVDPNFPPDGSGHTYYYSHTSYQLDSKAAFGELYVDPIEDVRVTLGARYTSDLKRQPLTPLQLFAPGRGRVTGATQRRVFNEWTGRANVEWKIAPDNMVYAGYSRGYKGGGFNPPVTGDPNSAFEPETVNAFEIGTKNQFLDRRLTLNLTGFYYKYNDYQYTVSAGLTTETRNINTTLYGLELESIIRPTQRFSINVNGGYLHTRIDAGPNNRSIDPWNITGGDPSLVALKNTSIACVGPASGVARLVAAINAGVVPASALVAACPTAAAPMGAFATSFGLPTSFGVPTDITGNRLPTSPRWNVSVGAQYVADFGEWSLTPRADFHYQSNVEGDVYNNPTNRADGWTNVNATLTLANAASGWSVQAFVKNLFDVEQISAVGVNSQSLGLTRRLYVLDPRTFGINVTKNF